MVQEPIAIAYLVIQQGPRAGKRIELCKDYTTIGRNRYCDIFLEDIAVHRKQASIGWRYVCQRQTSAGMSPRSW
jgi:hypothetical protein